MTQSLESVRVLDLEHEACRAFAFDLRRRLSDVNYRARDSSRPVSTLLAYSYFRAFRSHVMK